MSARKMSRRELLQTLAVGTAGAALVACGAAPATDSTTAPAASAETSALAAPTTAPGSAAYTGKFVIMSVSNPEQYDPMIKGIQEAHPGVQVEWRHLPSERFVELFTAAEVAGDQIDLMDLNGQDLRRYAVGGKLTDLSDVEFKDRFQDVAVQTYTIRGKLHALPRGGISGFTFLYNKKVLEQVGVTKELETYDELKAVAADLTKAGVAPFVHPGKNIYLWPIWQFWAHAQTSGNQAVENTAKTLAGEMKFTDPEHVAALEILHRFAQDGMFVDSVAGLDGDGANALFTQGKAAFLYAHTGSIGGFREGDFPELDLSLIPPLRMVQDSAVKRQMPGGTGNALAMYTKIAPERTAIALSIMDLMTSDTWVKWANDLNKDPASCNKDVQASDDPLAVKYAKECAPNQITYLDWNWPPEITRAFQENQQGIVAGTITPDAAAAAIEETMATLREEGYTFET